MVLHVLSRHGLAVVKRITPLLLVASFVLTAAVMVPGVGVTINGATRWLGAGPLQFQPSELLKVRSCSTPPGCWPSARRREELGASSSRCCWWWAPPACCC